MLDLLAPTPSPSAPTRRRATLQTRVRPTRTPTPQPARARAPYVGRAGGCEPFGRAAPQAWTDAQIPGRVARPPRRLSAPAQGGRGTRAPWRRVRWRSAVGP